ncbi:hypothetical protein ACIRBX_22455 [Kitasatospora sp. NPDC096147]|uniref:hypothetical protein n=1 Tax=Kitasatospora sp. NPDC096147 TaxID=3364093 RepID=UPI0037FCD592
MPGEADDPAVLAGTVVAVVPRIDPAGGGELDTEDQYRLTDLPSGVPGQLARSAGYLTVRQVGQGREAFRPERFPDLRSALPLRVFVEHLSRLVGGLGAVLADTAEPLGS